MLTLEELKVQCSELPADQRADLAHFLLESLDDGSEEEVAEAWRIEARQRLADMRAGRSVSIPAAEVFARLREKYGR